MKTARKPKKVPKECQNVLVFALLKLFFLNHKNFDSKFPQKNKNCWWHFDK